MPWRAGAREPSRPSAPGRARSTTVLIGRCFLIMQIICVDSAASCLTSPSTGAVAQGSPPGALQREPRERRAGTSSRTPASCRLSAGLPRPRPRLFPARPTPFYAPPPGTPPPVQPPALATRAPPPLSWSSPPVLGGDGGTGGTSGNGGRADGAGIWPRRPEGLRRPPAPARA